MTKEPAETSMTTCGLNGHISTVRGQNGTIWGGSQHFTTASLNNPSCIEKPSILMTASKQATDFQPAVNQTSGLADIAIIFTHKTTKTTTESKIMKRISMVNNKHRDVVHVH